MEKNNSVVVVCDSYYLSAKSVDSFSRSPSPNRSLKGFNLFRVISQKIGRGIRQSKEYKCNSSDDDEDSNSSMNSITRSSEKVENPKDESRCDCDYFYKNQRHIVISEKPFLRETEKEKTQEQEYRKKCLKFSTPCRHHHSSGSDTYSSNDDSSESNDTDQKSKRSHSSSNESSASSSSSSADTKNAAIRKGLKSLNLNSKSLSCFSISQLKESNERRESNSKEKRTKKSPQKILRQPATHTYVRGISGLPTLKVINTRACYNNQYSRG